VLVKRVLNKKVIIKVAGGGVKGDIYAIKKRKLGRLYLQLMKRADRVISVTKEITSQLVENGFPLSIIKEIPNGVDPREFSPREDPLSSQGRLITYVGRFDPLKGLDDLLKAFKMVNEKHPETRLVLVGDGEEKDNLIRLAHQLDIYPQVRFEGMKEGVENSLRESEVFAFPSLTEGLSNVLLEAMACGLPVVATRVGGNVELVEDGLNGFLINPRDPDGLAEAIMSLLEDKERAKQMGREGRRKVEERYSLDHIAGEYLMIYQQLGEEK
jgi:glycosyltransferase involved in cell wall biosynthesis